MIALITCIHICTYILYHLQQNVTITFKVKGQGLSAKSLYLPTYILNEVHWLSHVHIHIINHS